MAENENIENPNNTQEGGQAPEPKSYTQEELNALLEKARKEGETSGFVMGKTETNKKWERTVAEREKAAKEEAEKQAKFANMSESQRLQTQLEEVTKELQTMKDEKELNLQREETRKMLKEQGLDEFFLSSVLVKGDAEATLNRIKEGKQMFDAVLQKALEAKIPVNIPKQGSTEGEDKYSMAMARQVAGLKNK